MAEQIGVDFGTSHTVAVIGQTPLLFDSSPLLPSAVFADGDGRLLTGRDAYRSGQLDPARWEPNPKRRIDEGVLLLGAHEVPVRAAVAAVLARVGAEAGRALGGRPAGAVLTHPAGWAGVRRGVLADAASAAGFGGVRLVAEPVAAASYFTTVVGHRVPPGSAVVVYDFGAGTFDVSVLRRTPAGGWDVVASDGLPDVGGLDLDAAIVTFVGSRVTTVDPAVWARLTSPTTTVDQRHRRLLWEDARAVKEQLSRESSATLVVPLLDRDVIVTRAEFDALARPWLERTVNLTTSTLFGSGVTADRVVGVFLVGGSSRIPLVATMLHRALGMPPVVLEQPELVVAQGSLVPTEGAGVVDALPAAPVSPEVVPAWRVAPPVSGPPVSAPPVSAPPVSGPPVSGPPVSGPPVSGAPAVGSAPVVVPSAAARSSAAPSAAPRAAATPAVSETVVDPQGAPRPRWLKPALYTGAAVSGLIVLAASETVRYSAFAGAATVFRPATVLPFLATVLLVAGARRGAPAPMATTMRFGAVAGLSAAAALVMILKIAEMIATEIDRYTIRIRFDHASWIVSGVGFAAIVLGLVLILFRGIPDPDGSGRWRAVAYGFVAGVVPGASAYTAIWWTWFSTRAPGRDTQLFAALAALPRWTETPTAGMVLGLVAGWVVAMAAATLGGRALGEAVPPAARPLLHRAGAVVLAAAGAVLVYFMQVERGFMMKLNGSADDPTLMRDVTRLWSDTAGDVHPGLLAFLLVGAGGAAAALVVVRARQSQIRSGGS